MWRIRRLTRDGTAKPVSRDQIPRCERDRGEIIFPCSADHEQDWKSYLVDPYDTLLEVPTIHTYIQTTHPIYTSMQYKAHLVPFGAMHACKAPFAPEKLVARDMFRRPVPPQLAYSVHSCRTWCASSRDSALTSPPPAMCPQ